MRTRLLMVAGAGGALLLAGCNTTGAEPEPVEPAEPGTAVTTHRPVTVLDTGDGAELCLGGVMESYPPQCSGPRLLGWDWADHVDEYEEASGVRWGEFVVVGTYDGDDVTVNEVTAAADWQGTDPAEDPELGTPCPEPDGGWRVLDPGRTTDETLTDVMTVAAELDGYAGSWLDQSVNPASHDAEPDEGAMNDPTKLVVNVLVTGDPAVAEQRLREVWGGALCVSTAERTEAELRTIQEDLADVTGLLSSGVSVTENVVDLSVIFDDGALQSRLDEQHGEGVVRVSSALVPAQ